MRVQEKAGARDFAERIGRQVIRDYMPDQHREFFSILPYIFMGSLDNFGRPWASILCGVPGFVQTPDAQNLSVAAFPSPEDPAAANLKVGAPVGFVGVQLHTRRRNRLTGRIRAMRDNGFDVAVDQSFGNCPQYIQARQPVGSYRIANATSRAMGSLLDNKSLQLVQRADTLFIASASPGAGSSDPVEGADVNHRGGKPGFVRVERVGPRDVLTFPDYVGNLAFNTLGNIEINPKAGLLFVDFDAGNVLTMTCQAEIIWDGTDLADFRGAERLLRITIEESYFLERALSWEWTEPEQAQQLARTGSWEVVAAARSARLLGTLERPFHITSIKNESSTVKSIYLAPKDGSGILGFDAGQYVVVRVPANGGRALSRAYSLSRESGYESYRISVRKTVGGNVGPSVSRWLHDSAQVGAEITVKGPIGGFKLNAESKRSVLLLAGGIGVTPLLAMIKVLTAGTEGRLRFPDRVVWLIHAVANGADHPFREEIVAIAASRSNFRARFVYSRPLESDRPGIDFHAQGHIGRDLFRGLLPLDDYDAYVCGPAGFMQAAYDGLLALGLPDNRIYDETFGPDGIRRRNQLSVASSDNTRRTSFDRANVIFAQSRLSAAWQGYGTLLQLAESIGVYPTMSCRSGRCGSCVSKLVEGGVSYRSPPEYPCPEGSALVCVAEPSTETVVLDI